MAIRQILDNGLTVLLNEDHSSPVAAVLTHVKTGYFDEEDRFTGISHLLEHMFFKGTPRRPGPEDIARATKALGGVLNAFTYYEETGYYAVVPSERLAEAMDIQADAIANTLIDPAQLRSETEVVIQEGEQKRDSAWPLATESLFALAFDQHRIRRWRIGDPATLRSWSRDDVAAYYRGTYHPRNIVLAISGDFDPDEACRLAQRFFGGIQGGAPYVSPGPPEPAQTAPRFRQMRGDVRQRLILFAFHTVPSFHADSHALHLLSAVLSDGRASRLFRNVRDRLGLATALNTYHQTFRDIGVFVMAAESLGDDLDRTEAALWEEIRRLQSEPPADEELERVKTRIRARLVFDSEEPLGRARRLAEYEAMGGFELEEADLAALFAVTPQQVQRAAAAYLVPSNASLLEYVPAGSPIRETSQLWEAWRSAPGPAVHPPQAGHALTPGEAKAPQPVSPTRTAPAAEQRDLPAGTLATRRTGSQPVVALELLWRGGRRDETAANAGITNLMLRTVLKGNERRGAEDIARSFEGLGTTLEWIHGLDFFGFGFHVLEDRLEEALRLAADVIQTPAFAPADLDRERDAMLADIRRAEDNAGERALDMLDMAAYGDHPYSFPERGFAEALESLGPDDLRAWHAARTAAPLVAGAGGWVDADRLAGLLAGLFPAAEPAAVTPVPVPGWEGIVERVETRQRNQTAAAIGFRSVDALSEDRFALDLIAQVLSGLGGRLFAEVRGRQGLAYTVSAWDSVRRDAGMFVAYTATAPENEAKARESILAELQRLREEPIPEDEIARAVTYIAGTKTIGLQTSRAQARDLSRALVYGRPVEASAIYVQRLRQLTPDDLLAAARRYITPDSYALGVVRGR